MSEPLDPDVAPAPAPAPASNAPAGDSVLRGVLFVLAAHALAIVLVAAFGATQFAEAALMAFFFVGVFQWLYVVPLVIWAYATRRRQTAKGIWILAGVSLLPTVTCFGFLAQMDF